MSDNEKIELPEPSIIYFEERAKNLDDETQVSYGEEKSEFVELTNGYWTMTINFDLEAQELIFKTILRTNKWLAVGFSDSLINAAVIQWISNEQFQEEGTVTERISVKGVLKKISPPFASMIFRMFATILISTSLPR